MHSTHLHEHDAHQGAQSAGEFLGMTGNCGWYLLGAGGATILMVIFLWGILGVSLLLCLLVGVVLCGLSVAYVFALKNNKPAHYDTDYFESALVEAGVLPLRFGPRDGRPANPFASAAVAGSTEPRVAAGSREPNSSRAPRGTAAAGSSLAAAQSGGGATKAPPATERDEPMVARADYDRLHEQLTTTEELLEEALAERGED